MHTAQRTIVVVETHAAMNLLLDEVLTSEGYRVRLWSDGPSAAAFIRAEQPELVVLDLWLQQRGDGVPILEQLWADPATCQLPVIVFVDDTYSLPLDRNPPPPQRLVILEKPFFLDALVSTVAEVLSHAPALTAMTASGAGPTTRQVARSATAAAKRMPMVPQSR